MLQSMREIRRALAHWRVRLNWLIVPPTPQPCGTFPRFFGPQPTLRDFSVFLVLAPPKKGTLGHPGPHFDSELYEISRYPSSDGRLGMPSSIEAQKGSARANLKCTSGAKNDDFEWEVLHFLTFAKVDITWGYVLFGGGQKGPDLHFRLTPALPFWASMLERAI